MIIDLAKFTETTLGWFSIPAYSILHESDVLYNFLPIEGGGLRWG